MLVPAPHDHCARLLMIIWTAARPALLTKIRTVRANPGFLRTARLRLLRRVIGNQVGAITRLARIGGSGRGSTPAPRSLLSGALRGCVLVPGLVVGQHVGEKGAGMSEADNIALYRRLIDEGVGIGRLDTLEEVLAPGIGLPTVAPAAEPSIAGLKEVNTAFRAAFPDLRATIDEIFANGDWVTARLTWTGTNTGELFGQPPTGRSISVAEMEIVRCENGRIVELRQVIDLPGLMAQLSS